MKKMVVGKRFLSLLTVLCMLAAFAPQVMAAEPAEIAMSGVVLPYWSKEVASVEKITEEIDGVSTTVDKITVSDVWAGATVRMANAQPFGKKYLVDFYARTDESVTADSVKLRVHNPDNPDKNTFAGFEVTKEWKHFRGSFTAVAPSGDTSGVFWGVFIGGDNAAELLNKSFYIHSFKLYDVTEAELLSSIPADGASVVPTDTVTLKFSGAMPAAAAQAASYKISGGKNALSVVSVEEKADNTYVLHLSGKTENKAQYTLSFEGMTDWYGNVLEKQSITFFSSEKVLLSYSFNDGESIMTNLEAYVGSYDGNGASTSYVIDSAADSAENSSALKVTTNVDGGFASRIWMRDGSWGNINLNAGQKYYISYRYKAESAGSAAELIPMEGENLDWNVVKCALDSNEWKEFIAEYTATGSGAFQLLISGGKKGEIFYIDDIKLSTEADIKPFTLTASTPSDGGVCSTFDGITVEFSEALGSKGLAAESYTLSGGTQKVKTVESLGENKYRLLFDKFLTANTAYTLGMDVADVYGRPLKTEISFSTPAKILVKNGFDKNCLEAQGNKWATLQGYGMTDFGWDAENDASGSAASGSMKYTAGSSGTWNTTITVNDGEQNAVRMTGGKKYTALMKIKASAAAQLIPVMNNQSYGSFSVPGDGEWVSRSISFTPDSDSGIYFACQANEGTVIYIDDFVFLTDADALTVSGRTESVNVNYIILDFSNEMKEESVLNTANYSIANAEIDKIEKLDAKSVRVYFKELLPNVDYSLSYSGLEDVYTQKAEGSYSFNVTPENKLYFDETKLYLYYGTEGQHEITDGYVTDGVITAEVGGIMNFSGETANLRLVVGYYENGVLKNAAVRDMTVENGKIPAESLYAGVEVPEKTEGVTREIRAFLWDCGSLAPIGTRVDLHDFLLTTVHVAPEMKEGIDYTSPMAANAAISDSNAGNRYVIDIAPGVYDTYDAEETYYKNTVGGWTVKPYVTLRGQDRESCIIRGSLPDEFAATEAGRLKIQDWSTVNLMESCALENLTVTAENMRYPVHDEGGGTNRDAVHRIKNCHIEHKGNDGAIKYYKDNAVGNNEYDVWHWTTAYGYGAASGEVCIFENSTFKSNSRAWYVHSQTSFKKPQINILNNCRMTAGNMNDVTVESLGSGTDDRVVLNNCTFDGLYIAYNDSPWIYSDMNGQYADHSEYKLTLNNCDPIGFRNNHRGLALAVYSNSTDSSSAVNVSGSAAPVLFGETKARRGGRGVSGYTYGSYDISGILTTLASDKEVNNTIGRRLGDCTANAKLLTLTFDGDSEKSVTVRFARDYTALANAEILNEINSQISQYGTVAEYNVGREEYYPSFPDKEFIMTNGSSAAIPRFAAICVRDGKYVRMTSADSEESFAGVALERIVPGERGRVLTKGYLDGAQLGTREIANGEYISVNTNGEYEINGSGSRLMTCSNDYGWAYFAAEN